MMKRNAVQILLMAIIFSVYVARAEEPDNKPPSRHLTMQEAVQLALKHNHDIRLAGYTVEEKRQAKEAAKSSYYPSIRNDSNFLHVTDTQLIAINAGSLGVAAGTQIPPVTSVLNQGGRNMTTSGTQLTQPLTTLLKVKQENEVAQAELKTQREKAQLVGNDVELAVHEVYYQILIAQAHRASSQARVKASEALRSERVEQVEFGSTLERDMIDSRAQSLQAKQELLTTDLQLSDLKLKLNDLIGLPLTTAFDLDPAVPEFQQTCLREQCVSTAMDSHPEVIAARAEVEKAEAAVRLAKTDIWVPDVDAFARYSYANNVPFLARNFGTFGIHFGFDVFDSGRKKASLRGREAQLSQAKENLSKLTDQVKLAVETAYNKLERTQQMVNVSEEVLALRTESNRVLQQELARGAALNSQVEMTTAQEYDARALLLQTQLDYLQAHDEVIHATGGRLE
jgi:outer membrane protein TolC